MTRWLDDDEQRVWRAYLAVNRKLPEAIARRTQESGLPGGYYIIMAMLSEAPGRQLRMSDLAEMVSSSPSRISHAVDRLDERGWVRREKSPTDRRGNMAVLTDEGMRIVREAAPRHVQAVRESLFDLLTREQLAVLDEVFTTVNERLDARAPKGRGPTGALPDGTC